MTDKSAKRVGKKMVTAASLRHRCAILTLHSQQPDNFLSTKIVSIATLFPIFTAHFAAHPFNFHFC